MWFAATAAVNSGLVAWSASRGGVGSRAVDWSLATFCIAVAARHDGIVRMVFVLGRLVPSYRLHQLTYHLGQLHRAMAVAGIAWLAVAVTFAVPSSPVAGMASAAVLAILIVMARTARDRVRQSRHNRFESVHRLGGWAALGILAVIVPVEAAQSLPPGSHLAELIRQPSVLLLAVLVLLVAHPWLSVRRLPAEFLAVTSEVVVVALPGRRLLGEFVRVSREGHEWHSFAVATATGAGIGPVLPYLLSRPQVQFDCLWIGRCHRAAMGTDLVDRVLASGSVTLIDTSRGRPDIGACVADVARRFDAVFVVSNDVVRDVVAKACESLGVPWYGPTFDS